MHSSYVRSKCCHFLFYWMIREKVDSCVCGGWFSVYVYVEFCLLASYCQVEEVHGSVFFIRGVEIYVVV